MVWGVTPSRSFSSVRSRISVGTVSSMNSTSGSMVSGYWTRACIMDSSSLRLREQAALVGLALPGPFNSRRGSR